MTATVQLWTLPAVEGPTVSRRMEQQTVEHLENAYEEAFAQGRDAGLLAGRKQTEARLAELDARIAQMDATLSLLAKPLAEMDAQVEQQLVNLAMAIAKQLVRRELRIDPGQIIATIRETVNLLPTAARDVRVYLHPEDAALVRERLASPAAERAWNIVEDPVLSRGGCRVASETSQVDARLETRMGAIISTLLGDERAAAVPENA